MKKMIKKIKNIEITIFIMKKNKIILILNKMININIFMKKMIKKKKN